MKWLAWGGGALVFISLAGVSWPRVWGSMEVLAAAWWILPLFASLGALLALEGSLVFRCFGRARGSAIPTAAYLISGPSAAAFNLSVLFRQPAPPPSWIGGLMLLLVFGSAWAYYLSSGDQGDERGRPDPHPPFLLSSA